MLKDNVSDNNDLEETPQVAEPNDLQQNIEAETEENLQDLEESTNVISDSYTSLENFNEEDVLKLVTESVAHNVSALCS